MKSEQFQTFTVHYTISFFKNHFISQTSLLASKKVTHSYILSDIPLHSVNRLSNIQSA